MCSDNHTHTHTLSHTHSHTHLCARQPARSRDHRPGTLGSTFMRGAATIPNRLKTWWSGRTCGGRRPLICRTCQNTYICDVPQHVSSAYLVSETAPSTPCPAQQCNVMLAKVCILANRLAPGTAPQPVPARQVVAPSPSTSIPYCLNLSTREWGRVCLAGWGTFMLHFHHPQPPRIRSMP